MELASHSRPWKSWGSTLSHNRITGRTHAPRQHTLVTIAVLRRDCDYLYYLQLVLTTCTPGSPTPKHWRSPWPSCTGSDFKTRKFISKQISLWSDFKTKEIYIQNETIYAVPWRLVFNSKRRSLLFKSTCICIQNNISIQRFREFCKNSHFPRHDFKTRCDPIQFGDEFLRNGLEDLSAPYKSTKKDPLCTLTRKIL